MAAILDALAPYVKKLIADMAQDEVSMLLGVSSEITKLEDNMEGLRAFLTDAERRRITDKSVQRWTIKLKNATYDATDILDLCQLEADKRRESRGGSGMERQKAPSCFQPLLFCLRNPLFAHKIGSRIKELNQRLEGIHTEADKYKFNIGLGSDPEPRQLNDAELPNYRTSSQIEESAIVGEQIERDTRELVQVVTADVDDNHNIKIVSIIGTGGMGKTTLAQKIFNDATIQEHFKTKIWLSITQHFDEAELLRTAIKHAGGNHGWEKDKSTLMDTLINTLSTGKFLLVMDDVWSRKAWDDVLNVPVRIGSKKQPGSWVLVTTRFAHLPLQMQAALYQHRVSPLDKDDAWSLLKKQLQPDQVAGIHELRNIGIEILERCNGLPLAIKVIGGLLSTRIPSEREWMAVLNSPAWSVTGLPAELDSRLYLVYEDLSPHLKQCFLYCSLFSKGEDITRNVITKMWISEGFIQTHNGSSTSSHKYGLEEIGGQYYQELIKRNLIEPTYKYSFTGQRCIMRDVVRSFAEHMAREESLVMLDNEQASTSMHGTVLVRRLSIGQTVSIVEWAALHRQVSLRTLILNSRVNYQHGDSLCSFSSLRVLYIWYADFDQLVASLSTLKHLRYLHLENTDISRLPDDIHKMKFLRYIHLLDCDKLGHLPTSTIKLVHLRSFDITGSAVTVPKGFGRLTNLRSLYGFPVQIDIDARSWCSLQELASLSQLRDLTLYGLEKVTEGWMVEEANISSMGHLRYLELNYSRTAEQHQRLSVIGQIMDKLCPPTCIENLTVRGGYVGLQLPNWMRSPASRYFKSLRILNLQDLLCCIELPDGLRCLPCLELLDIKHAPAIKRIGFNFQASSFLAVGTSTETAAPFPKLATLQLDELYQLEEWEWDDCEDKADESSIIAMPCMERLYIRHCKLSCLPQGIASSKRHALRELCLYHLINLTSVHNIPSGVELDVFECPELKVISSLYKLLKIRIVRCPKLQVLEQVPSLDTVELEDTTMETIPGYLQNVNPRYLKLHVSKKLYESLSPGSFEWNKISRIRKRNVGYI